MILPSAPHGSSRSGVLRLLALPALLLCGAAAAAPAIPPPPGVAASAHLLMDADTGKVIAERNSHEHMAPASLTKVMTAFVAAGEIQAGRIAATDEVLVSVNAWRTGGSRMFIREGSRVTVQDLMRGIIVQSGNDASVALAEHVAGTEEAFTAMMNHQAAELGMSNTHFLNATGLPDEDHYTSAWDIAVLTREYIRRFPENYALYAEKSFSYNDIEQPNRNRLLFQDRSVDGVKTGYTEDAGYCLLASAVRNGMRLISVVMGADSTTARTRESQKLLSYGFRFYETKRLYEPGPPLKNVRVWFGASDDLELGVAEAVVVTLPRGSYDEVAVEMSLAEVIEAPVAAGDRFGELRVLLGEEEIQVAPLVALAPVAEAGMFARFADFVVLMFTQLFQ